MPENGIWDLIRRLKVKNMSRCEVCRKESTVPPYIIKQIDRFEVYAGKQWLIAGECMNPTFDSSTHGAF